MHTARKTTNLPVEWISDPIAQLLFSIDKDARKSHKRMSMEEFRARLDYTNMFMRRIIRS